MGQEVVLERVLKLPRRSEWVELVKSEDLFHASTLAHAKDAAALLKVGGTWAPACHAVMSIICPYLPAALVVLLLLLLPT